MTFREYYNLHFATGGFFELTDFDIYTTIPRDKRINIMTQLSSNIVAIGGNMTYSPVWQQDDDRLTYSLERISFLSQYPLEELYKRFTQGFSEVESESKTDTNNTTASTNATTGNDTFKSFPQVADTELSPDTKIGRTSSSDNSSTTSVDTATGSRELTRSYNTPEATEYFAKFFSDILMKIAKDFVGLTALDGVYYAPDLD